MDFTQAEIKVFFPFIKSRKNLFLDELEAHRQEEWIFGDIDGYAADCAVVNIHWPEAIFMWKEPTEEELNKFETTLRLWKRNSVIIYTRHNLYPHYNNSRRYRQLYDMIIQHADCIVHLGKYSLQEFSESKPHFDRARHVVIPHHLYTLYPNDSNKQQSRSALGIPLDAKVLLVFGAIRSAEERNFVFKVFRQLNSRNKVLVVPCMDYFLPKWLSKSLLGRMKSRITKAVNAFYTLLYHCKLGNQRIDNDDVQYYCKASDVILIPRHDSLNSGIALLGLSFNIPVVGPDIGNISEVLRDSRNYTYESKNSTQAAEIISSILNNPPSLLSPSEYAANLHPQMIARQYSDLFRRLILSHRASLV